MRRTIAFIAVLSAFVLLSDAAQAQVRFNINGGGWGYGPGVTVSVGSGNYNCGPGYRVYRQGGGYYNPNYRRYRSNNYPYNARCNSNQAYWCQAHREYCTHAVQTLSLIHI